jgi:hypothetical protein
MAAHALMAASRLPRLPLLRTTPVAAVGLVAWLAPAVAAACPYCAGSQHGGPGTSIALGVFLLLPFVVAGVVYSVLRAHGNDAEGAASGPPAE